MNESEANGELRLRMRVNRGQVSDLRDGKQLGMSCRMAVSLRGLKVPVGLLGEPDEDGFVHLPDVMSTIDVAVLLVHDVRKSMRRR